jgi:hypothetical protein
VRIWWYGREKFAAPHRPVATCAGSMTYGSTASSLGALGSAISTGPFASTVTGLPAGM